MSDLVFLPAHQLAQMIRDRQVSAAEVVDAHLAQIVKYNSQLNAICTPDERAARNAARQADEALARGENWGALHGVPITVKDVFATAGLLTTAGSLSLKDYVPQQDATAVARLKSAGAIVLGKTNIGDLAGGYQGLNDVFPRVNNPWNLEYTPGGTSSGGAAAIAAGLSPIDLCSDLGGSIRQPAHFCGIYGFKPTDRLVPTTGHIPEVPGAPRCLRQMLTVGTLARSIEDLSLCLQIIAGADRSQPDIPSVPLERAIDKPRENLRIAWVDEWANYPVAAEIKSAMRSVATKLTGVGIAVEEWVPDFDFPAAWQTYYELVTYNLVYARSLTMADLRQNLAFLWRDSSQGDREFRKLGNLAKIGVPISLNPTLKGYFETLTQRDRFTTQMDAALSQWDVWLCPVAMTPAFTHRDRGAAVRVDDRHVPYSMASGAYLVTFNLTGHPVVVIPIGQTESGLPIGMQIVGKRWQDLNLLAIARELDSALPTLRDRVVGNFQQPTGY
ncbi:amidase [Chamaesiphon polymorphus]|uniref:Amidase n=1 Tax=Chamaesiphon polymorphus CCALA 037 TaxID=2107692 RepID=A0A2T1GMK9_9CYAN|nr:amidase [Chamaesiphon polymorphus]PSB59106.1 amidase [Chamaesiphon polymorphus CCALA 037]